MYLIYLATDETYRIAVDPFDLDFDFVRQIWATDTPAVHDGDTYGEPLFSLETDPIDEIFARCPTIEYTDETTAADVYRWFVSTARKYVSQGPVYAIERLGRSTLYGLDPSETFHRKHSLDDTIYVVSRTTYEAFGRSGGRIDLRHALGQLAVTNTLTPEQIDSWGKKLLLV